MAAPGGEVGIYRWEEIAMPKVKIGARQLREMFLAAEQYGTDHKVAFNKVYVMMDTGINVGDYVISDAEWDERERIGEPHPAFSTAEPFPPEGQSASRPTPAPAKPSRSRARQRPLFGGR